MYTFPTVLARLPQVSATLKYVAQKDAEFHIAHLLYDVWMSPQVSRQSGKVVLQTASWLAARQSVYCAFRDAQDG